MLRGFLAIGRDLPCCHGSNVRKLQKSSTPKLEIVSVERLSALIFREDIPRGEKADGLRGSD